VSTIGRAECDLKMTSLSMQRRNGIMIRGRRFELDIIAMFSSTPLLRVEFYADVGECMVGQISLSCPRRGSMRRMGFQLREAHLHFLALTARLFKFMAQDIRVLATSLDYERTRIADRDLAFGLLRLCGAIPGRS